MNFMIPEISDKVKNLCITWETGKLSLIIQHALHAEKLPTQSMKERIRYERLDENLCMRHPESQIMRMGEMPRTLTS